VWIFDAQPPSGRYPWLTKRFVGPSGTLYAIDRSQLD
jgi:hypothetical protein